MLRRWITDPITQDLESGKMVFLAGPRQVGKTTLARHLLEESGSGIYLNWDNRNDRGEIRSARWPGGEALIVLDEITSGGDGSGGSRVSTTNTSRVSAS